MADIKSEPRPASNRNRWPASYWNEWPASSESAAGGYSVVRDRVRDLRPASGAGYEVRFETPPGEQAQVDFARFEVEFTVEPGVRRIV